MERTLDYGPYRVLENSTEDNSLDITIMDGADTVLKAQAPNDNPQDITIDCTHQEIDFTEDDERGTCLICGAECDWSWDGFNDEGYSERVITNWHEEYTPTENSILGRVLHNA